MPEFGVREELIDTVLKFLADYFESWVLDRLVAEIRRAEGGVRGERKTYS